MVYKLPTAVGQGVVCYTSFPIESDENVSHMFYCHSQCPEIHVIKLFVTFKDTNVSSEGSAPNPPFVGTDFSARGSNPNPNLVTYPTSLLVPSMTFAFTVLELICLVWKCGGYGGW